ncbi:hypothetical protein KJ359_009396 [Pestalotiopsis sp. 9143b]|nr:hypothetical protein KJ359_009396 [Pestalotiopsis sp. 9143b]
MATSLPAAPADRKSKPPVGKFETIDATIVSRHPPDIPHGAYFVGICTVPLGREGKEDLGHHVADFLAWKHLYSTLSTYADDQVWLSRINLDDAADKHKYTHSGRDVSSVATDSAIPITVEPNVHALHGQFMKHLLEKAASARETQGPLVIIACGLTSLEQDIFFFERGGHVPSATMTSGSIRDAVDQNQHVLLITPSITSVGWQMNPSLGKPISTVAEPDVLMARRCGAVFGARVIRGFYDGQDAPAPKALVPRKFSVPVKKSEELLTIEGRLHAKIHACLSGRFISSSDHSFCFNREGDPWTLIGPRVGESLSYLARQLSSLGRPDITDGSSQDAFKFLGNAFGGNRNSQLSHFEFMFKQGLQSPGYSSVNMNLVQQHYDQLKRAALTDEEEAHILFNALEHRMSLVMLGDLATQKLGLSPNLVTRCRDWSQTAPQSDDERALVMSIWAQILTHVPPVDMPYGRHIDATKGLFKSLTAPLKYIAHAVATRPQDEATSLDKIVVEVASLFNTLKMDQVEQVWADLEVKELVRAWVKRCIQESPEPIEPSEVIPVINRQDTLSPVVASFVPGASFHVSRPKSTDSQHPPKNNVSHNEVALPLAVNTIPSPLKQERSGMPHQLRRHTPPPVITPSLETNYVASIVQSTMRDPEPKKGYADDEVDDLARPMPLQREFEETVTTATQPTVVEAGPLKSGEDDESHLLPHQRKRPVKTQARPVLGEQDANHLVQPVALRVPSGKSVVDQSHLPPHLRQHPFKLRARNTSMDHNATPVAEAVAIEDGSHNISVVQTEFPTRSHTAANKARDLEEQKAVPALHQSSVRENDHADMGHQSRLPPHLRTGPQPKLPKAFPSAPNVPDTPEQLSQTHSESQRQSSLLQTRSTPPHLRGPKTPDTEGHRGGQIGKAHLHPQRVATPPSMNQHRNGRATAAMDTEW